MEEQQNPCEEPKPCELPKDKYPLWGITYHVIPGDGRYIKGTAVVRALHASDAEEVLKHTSAFNGTPNAIIVEATAELPDITESGLCIETYEDGTHRWLNYGQ